MVQINAWRKFMMMAVLMLVVSMTLTSCQNLRKKFTRKKKQTTTEDRGFTPVLEPEEYPAPEENPPENYKQHYSLIKIWYTDLWTLLREKNAEKRAMYILKQVLAHIDEMEKLVKAPVRIELEKLRSYLGYYEESLAEPAASRNVSRIQSDLWAFDRLLRRLSAKKITDSFITVTTIE